MKLISSLLIFGSAFHQASSVSLGMRTHRGLSAEPEASGSSFADLAGMPPNRVFARPVAFVGAKNTGKTLTGNTYNTTETPLVNQYDGQQSAALVGDVLHPCKEWEEARFGPGGLEEIKTEVEQLDRKAANFRSQLGVLSRVKSCKSTLYREDERCYCSTSDGENLTDEDDQKWALRNKFKGDAKACEQLCQNRPECGERGSAWVSKGNSLLYQLQRIVDVRLPELTRRQQYIEQYMKDSPDISTCQFIVDMLTSLAKLIAQVARAIEKFVVENACALVELAIGVAAGAIDAGLKALMPGLIITGAVCEGVKALKNVPLCPGGKCVAQIAMFELAGKDASAVVCGNAHDERACGHSLRRIRDMGFVMWDLKCGNVVTALWDWFRPVVMCEIDINGDNCGEKAGYECDRPM